MDQGEESTVPSRAETLKVLRLMGRYAPILMLGDDPDGFGTRWTLHGQAVSPVIAKYLLHEDLLADAGPTELGVRRLVLTEAGIRFREDGLLWWSGLGLLQKLKVMIRG